MNPIDDVTQKLLGQPTSEELKDLYLRLDFDRGKIARHLGISTGQLNRLKKKLLGNCVLPSSASYIRQYNEVQWYTGCYAEWTHVPHHKTCRGNSNDLDTKNPAP